MHWFAAAVPLAVAPLGCRLIDQPKLTGPLVFSGFALVPTFAFDKGAAAAVWVLPFIAVAPVMAAGELSRWAVERRATPVAVAPTVAAGFLFVSAASLALSRAGVTIADIHEPIAELTAVHYGFAGFGGTILAKSAATVATRWRRPLGTAGLVATMIAPPIVAAGFVTGGALPQVGGAVLLAIGVWATALLTAVDGFRRAEGNTKARTLLVVAAAAPIAPMVLAVSWAAAQHWLVPALSIPTMARVHGTLNAVGFIGCGLAGYRLALDKPATSEVVAC